MDVSTCPSRQPHTLNTIKPHYTQLGSGNLIKTTTNTLSGSTNTMAGQTNPVTGQPVNQGAIGVGALVSALTNPSQAVGSTVGNVLNGVSGVLCVCMCYRRTRAQTSTYVYDIYDVYICIHTQLPPAQAHVYVHVHVHTHDLPQQPQHNTQGGILGTNTAGSGASAIGGQQQAGQAAGVAIAYKAPAGQTNAVGAYNM